jgi:hypothetical protein
MSVIVTAFRNDAEDLFRRIPLRGEVYQLGDLMEPYPLCVERFIVDTTSDESICSQTFRMLNRVDGTEPIPDGFRSLSCGDTIRIERFLMDGTIVLWYAVAACGFTRLEVAPLRKDVLRLAAQMESWEEGQ